MLILAVISRHVPSRSHDAVFPPSPHFSEKKSFHPAHYSSSGFRFWKAHICLFCSSIITLLGPSNKLSTLHPWVCFGGLNLASLFWRDVIFWSAAFVCLCTIHKWETISILFFSAFSICISSTIYCKMQFLVNVMQFSMFFFSFVHVGGIVHEINAVAENASSM